MTLGEWSGLSVKLCISRDSGTVWFFPYSGSVKFHSFWIVCSLSFKSFNLDKLLELAIVD